MGVRACAVATLLFAVAGCASTEDGVHAGEDSLASDAKIEIKMALSEVESGPTLLGAKPNDAELRAVTFYDTTELALFASGVILRARRVTGDDDDSTIKLRPMSATRVDAKWLGLDGFKCEYDKNVGARAVSSCSLTQQQGPAEIANAARGAQRTETLFTPAQLAYVEGHHGAIDWATIRPLGPIAAEVWKLEPVGLDGETITIERWAVPGGARSLEVSIKVKGVDAAKLEPKLVAWVASRGLHPAEQQVTKTKAALTVLAGRTTSTVEATSRTP